MRNHFSPELKRNAPQKSWWVWWWDNENITVVKAEICVIAGILVILAKCLTTIDQIYMQGKTEMFTFNNESKSTFLFGRNFPFVHGSL